MLREEVISKLKGPRLATYVVYLPMLFSDKRSAAEESFKSFDGFDARGFWDGKRELAKSLGAILPLPNKRKIAWDVYLLYPPGAAWTQTPPRPSFWMHQLADDELCLDAARFYDKAKAALSD